MSRAVGRAAPEHSTARRQPVRRRRCPACRRRWTRTTSTPPTGPTRCRPRSRGDLAADLRAQPHQQHGLGDRPDDLQGDPHGPGPAGPEHVVPSCDLKTLWVNSDTGNALTPIDPKTGTFGKPIPVNDPYNLYFTPDGKYAIVMAEAAHEIVFRDPHTMAIRKTVPVQLRRRQPRRLLRRRPLLHRQLRVLRRPAQGRHRDAGASSASCTCRHAADAAGREDLAGRQDLVRRRHADSAACGSCTATASPTRRSCRPARARTACTSAATPSSLYITNRGEGIDLGARLRHRNARPPSGTSPAAAARTWAASPPTARCCGCRGRYNNVVYAIATDDRPAHPQDPGRHRPARPVRLAAARPLLPRPHRHPAIVHAKRRTRTQRCDHMPGHDRRVRDHHSGHRHRTRRDYLHDRIHATARHPAQLAQPRLIDTRRSDFTTLVTADNAWNLAVMTASCWPMSLPRRPTADSGHDHRTRPGPPLRSLIINVATEIDHGTSAITEVARLLHAAATPR